MSNAFLTFNASSTQIKDISKSNSSTQSEKTCEKGLHLSKLSTCPNPNSTKDLKRLDVYTIPLGALWEETIHYSSKDSFPSLVQPEA